ncbi:MAG: CDP-alcohol phosphatidyltransferase class-I family protein [Amphiamblys sp. WSBS2006]|nr:MAG: CDP-alcohol phosphatidyltransferase class-I family protein [Amphiamblys sp. WSBS2006]
MELICSLFPPPTPEELAAVEGHRSTTEDSSMASEMLQPLWDFLAKQVPDRVNPNAITAAGLATTVSQALLLTAANPSFSSALPRALCLASFFSVWLYLTLDAIDGKHARRTGKASPLGHFVDHAADAINSLPLTMIWAQTMQMTRAQTVVLLAVIYSGFLTTTWEEYHTQCLSFGRVSGPTEGILLLSLCMVASAVFSPRVWAFQPLSPHVSLSLSGAVVWGSAALLLATHIPNSLRNVKKKTKTGFRKTTAALLGSQSSFGVLLLYGLLRVGSMSSPGFLFFLLSAGSISAQTINEIIFASLAKRKYPPPTPPLHLLFCWCVLAKALPSIYRHETGFFALLALASTAYLCLWHFAVCSALCKHFNRPFLR